MPIRPLLINSKADFSELNAANSTPLPARFVLELSRPLVLAGQKCRKLAKITQFDDFFDDSDKTPLLRLLTKTKSDGYLDTANNRGLFVTLPDQQHCYFLSDIDDDEDFLAVSVEKIPFRHPRQVPDILEVNLIETVI